MAASVTLLQDCRGARLALYLREQAAFDFAWGSRDCGTLACDWILAETGRDPMAAERGRYRTALGARRLFGPFLPGMTSRIDACLRRTTPGGLRMGDIALVEAATGPSLTIATGAGLAGRALHGIGFGRLPILVCWSLEPA